MTSFKETSMKFVYFLVLSIKCISACNFSVTIKQDLLNDGFHRNMTYDISIVAFVRDGPSDVWPYKDCHISLHQPLPAGIYANPDELDELNRSHRLHAVTKKTNVELPTHLAESNMAYIFQKIRGPWLQTWLPLHARYHKAAWFGGYAVNKIEEPSLYMRCPDDRLEHCDRPLVPYKFLCIIHSNEKCIWKKIPFTVISVSESPVRIGPALQEISQYKQKKKIIRDKKQTLNLEAMNIETILMIPFLFSTESPVIWQTPIGDLNHYYPVAIATTMVVIMGSIYLVLSINKAKCYMLDYDRTN